MPDNSDLPNSAYVIQRYHVPDSEEDPKDEGWYDVISFPSTRADPCGDSLKQLQMLNLVHSVAGVAKAEYRRIYRTETLCPE